MGLQKVGGGVLRESFHKMGHPAQVLKDESKSSTTAQHIQSLNTPGAGALPIPGYLCPLQATLHCGAGTSAQGTQATIQAINSKHTDG